MKDIKTMEEWASWYKEYQGRQREIPWNSLEMLPSHLNKVVGDSVKIFQLGESSEAHSLKAKIAKHVKKGGSKAYQEAMDWFIHEENRHSRLLGRFMSLERMPKAQNSSSDFLFRQIRRFCSLRYAHVILSSAEMLAVPYYEALQKVGKSAVLAAICTQILEDEARHLQFQAHIIRMHMQGLPAWRRKMAKQMARILLELATDVVWYGHAELLRLAGHDFASFRKAGLGQFELTWQLIEGQARPSNAEHLSSKSLKRDALWQEI